jgi:5-methylcytosine-specific restriction endonuclease McrA
VTEKTCNTCGIIKPVDDFQKRAASADGRLGRCRDCRNADRRAKYPQERGRVLAANKARYEANREARIAAAVAWKAANPGKVKRYNRTSYERHREWIREYDRQWYLENRERVLEACRQWRRANPELAIQRSQRRRALIAETTLGEVDLVALWDEQGGTCALCAEHIDADLGYPDPMSKSIDHIVPLAKGGTHEQSNLQWTHLVCNLRKGARPIA